MNDFLRYRLIAAVIFPSLAFFFCASTPPCHAQAIYVTPDSYHIYLPPTRGATVLSTHIDARARYVAAVGSYLVSRSIARRNDAIAYEHEIKNQVLWLESYFQRKQINKAYRTQHTRKYRHPLERLAKVKAAAKYKIKYAPQEILRWTHHG